MTPLRLGACFISLACALVACSGGNGDAHGRQADPSPQASSPVSEAEALPKPAPVIKLACSAGYAVPKPGEGTNLQGVAATFFGWRPNSERNLDAVPTVTLWGRKYYQLKSPLSVFEAAGARTEISLLLPASARLYYTDWATWAKLGQSDASNIIAESASSAVSVPQCGQKGWTVPGLVLLESPTCVTFRVSGPSAESEQTITVPFNREHC